MPSPQPPSRRDFPDFASYAAAARTAFIQAGLVPAASKGGEPEAVGREGAAEWADAEIWSGRPGGPVGWWRELLSPHLCTVQYSAAGRAPTPVLVRAAMARIDDLLASRPPGPAYLYRDGAVWISRVDAKESLDRFAAACDATLAAIEGDF